MSFPLPAETSMSNQPKIANALVLLRLSIFVVMLMWTLDKFINPQHSAGVYANFYKIGGLEANVIMIIAILELLLLLAFVIGFKKRISYGLVFILHAVSTISTIPHYLDPFNNLLFFAAIPMLAGCWALFSLRDLDTRLTVG
jgi:putative oxidoreductase